MTTPSHLEPLMRVSGLIQALILENKVNTTTLREAAIGFEAALKIALIPYSVEKQIIAASRALIDSLVLESAPDGTMSYRVDANVVASFTKAIALLEERQRGT